MTDQKFDTNSEVTFKGFTVLVKGYSKGWYSLLTEEGDTVKARAKDLSEVKAGNESDDEDTTKVRIKPRMENYTIGLGQTVSGRDTVDIDDGTAGRLRGLDAVAAIQESAKLMVELGQEYLSKGMKKQLAGINFDGLSLFAFFQERYEGKNNGMVRMNMGNVLRGMEQRLEKQLNKEEVK